MAARYEKPKYQPYSVRFRVADKPRVAELARQRGMTIPALIRSLVLPHIAFVSVNGPEQVVIPLIPPRSIVAPANRAPQEPTVSRSGFAERTK